MIELKNVCTGYEGKQVLHLARFIYQRRFTCATAKIYTQRVHGIPIYFSTRTCPYHFRLGVLCL